MPRYPSAGCGADGSLFQHAPPIWQQVNAKICANGTVTTSGGSGSSYSGVAEQSLMPDLWLYKNNAAITQTGVAGSGPVLSGDFTSFSNTPVGSPHPWGLCTFIDRGLRAGNPWGMAFLEDADSWPSSVVFCDNPGLNYGFPYGEATGP
jgi:hypothetical protein